jgi:Fur family ferric uptake transcriptional regulator
METRIERLCVERGLKMTGQRRVIARVLSEASDHPDVEELYRRASTLDARISIATVYRTVRLLEEKGILERRDFGGGRARYEATEHGHHYHLIDIETGRVIEFEDAEHLQMMRDVARRLGFDLVSMRLELFGRKIAVATTSTAPATAERPAPRPAGGRPTGRPTDRPTDRPTGIGGAPPAAGRASR